MQWAYLDSWQSYIQTKKKNAIIAMKTEKQNHDLQKNVENDNLSH